MLKHVNADKHPEIVLNLEKYQITEAPSQFAGKLTINGVTKPVQGMAFVKDGRVVASFETKITDYGMEQPKKFPITVQDLVSVNIEFSYP